LIGAGSFDEHGQLSTIDSDLASRAPQVMLAAEELLTGACFPTTDKDPLLPVTHHFCKSGMPQKR
jgi:hypothetical protein